MKKRVAVLVSVLAVLLSLLGWRHSAVAQLRAEHFDQERYPPQNPTLISTIGGPVHTVAVQGSHAYIGEGECLTVLEISDPMSPSVVSRKFLGRGTVQDLFVYDTHAYIATQQGYLSVVNIADPSDPIEIGSVIQGGYASLRSVVVADEYLYVVKRNHVTVLDVSTPSDPTVIASERIDIGQNSFGNDIALNGTHAYIASDGGMPVVDILSPVNPTMVGSWEDVSCSFRGIAVHGNHAYLAGVGFSGVKSGVAVMDISSPAEPTIVSALVTPDDVSDIVVEGSYAYIAESGDLHEWGDPEDYDGWLRIADLSTPTSPTLVGACDIEGTAKEVAISGDYAFVAALSAGLRVVEISTPSEPTEVGSYEPPANVGGIAINEGFAYAADAQGAFSVMDISSLALPIPTGSCPLPDMPGEVVVQGDYAYVLGDPGEENDRSWLRIVDVSDPSSPEIVGERDTLVGAERIAIGDQYAYVTSKQTGDVWVVDISSPSSPVEVASMDCGSSDIAIAGDLVYTVGSNWLSIWDASEPSSPYVQSIWSAHEDADLREVAVSGDHAFVAGQYDGGQLWVIDVSDPDSPAESGSCDIVAAVTDLVASQHFVYGVTRHACFGSYFWMVDVSNPSHPMEVGRYSMSETPGDVEAGPHSIHIAAGLSGLHSLRHTGAYFISGQIRDSAGAPFPEAAVSITEHVSTTTSEEGHYCITGLVTDTYMFTPTKSGWTFVPPTRTVTLPPSAAGQDFTGYSQTIQSGVELGSPSAVVVYRLPLTNTGTALDTFEVSLSGNSWPVSVPSTVGPLAPNGQAVLPVTISVPTLHLGGQFVDTVSVTLCSMSNSLVSTTMSLTTEGSSAGVGLYCDVYLPVVLRLRE